MVVPVKFLSLDPTVLAIVEYSFIAITSRSTLTRIGSSC